MDKDIKTALAAAVKASFLHDGDEERLVPLHARRERHWRVAHELAAFLRALPETIRLNDGLWQITLTENSRVLLAQAVERVAGES
jgi:hypothetical protein